MQTIRKLSWLSILATLALVLVFPVLAQSGEELVLTVNRDFGYSGFNGKDIQGTFSMKAAGPEDLVKVAFYIDDEEIGDDTEAPFKIQFNTGGYSLGVHSLSAIGMTSDGKEIKSLVHEKNFVTADEGMKTAMRIVVPLLILVLGISLVSIIGPVLLGRNKKSSLPFGAPRSYGAAGGTICSKCGRPFALNFFALNMLFGKLVRCPHCGKVGVMARRSPTELKKAEEAELAMAAGDAPQVQGMSEEEKLQKELDDSRYQGM
jgi:DNA-directed RNA polymerase subunit RPC12/RpoP